MKALVKVAAGAAALLATTMGLTGTAWASSSTFFVNGSVVTHEVLTPSGDAHVNTIPTEPCRHVNTIPVDPCRNPNVITSF
jgi:hypothetical protein